jgi:Zn-dependent peptidase ImmA (M78 family)
MAKFDYHRGISTAQLIEIAILERMMIPSHGGVNTWPSHQMIAEYYNAEPFIIAELNKLSDTVFEANMSGGRLGITIVDNLGISVTINKLITNPQRKLFTMAHELCHLILDIDWLKENPNYDTQRGMSFENTNNPRDVRANQFAAYLLLPYNVLDALMQTRRDKYFIHSHQMISYEALRYRMVQETQYLFRISKTNSQHLINYYLSKKPSERDPERLFAFWEKADRISSTTKPISDAVIDNNRIAEETIDPHLRQHRIHKQKIITYNSEQRLKGQYRRDDSQAFSMLAEARDNLYWDDLESDGDWHNKNTN